MPKSAKMPFFSYFWGISQLCCDVRMASQCRLDPGFSANLRKVRLRLTLNSEVLTPSQWLVLYLRVKAKNRPTLGQKSFFNPIWRGGTRQSKTTVQKPLFFDISQKWHFPWTSHKKCPLSSKWAKLILKLRVRSFMMILNIETHLFYVFWKQLSNFGTLHFGGHVSSN
jgi:hypothetical protein